jgi:hypothetical protein
MVGLPKAATLVWALLLFAAGSALAQEFRVDETTIPEIHRQAGPGAQHRHHPERPDAGARRLARCVLPPYR